MAKSLGGRPSKFTPRVVLAIVADIGDGMSREDVAARAGVGASTLYRWLQRGRAGDPQYVDLARAIRIAQNSEWYLSKLTLAWLTGKVR